MASTPCADCGALVPAGADACAECGAPSVAAPATPVEDSGPPNAPPVFQRPAAETPNERLPASRRNTAAGIIALLGVLLVVVGTFLPIVDYDLDDLALDAGLIEDSENGWTGSLNDGPIHAVVCLLPLAMGILALTNRARVLVKVLLIVSALIGFFWVFVRFADISGSLEEGTTADVIAEYTDPGIGLYVIAAGWVLVLVAGIVAKAGTPPVSPAAPYAGSPTDQSGL